MFQNDLLTGRHILVTGGGSGLGRSIAQRYLELGARVAICGRRQAVLEETKAAFEADFPGKTAIAVCDIRDPEQIREAVDSFWRVQPLDGLVNNAAGNFVSRSETLSPRAFDAILNIVVHGTAYMTLEVGRRWLAEKRRGAVVSITATYAETGSAYVMPSAVAKSGVRAMTQSLAVEWGGRGIRLNAIAPGPFPTEGAWERLIPDAEREAAWKARVPLGRFGEHRELVDLAAFLISDGSGYINGESVVIDGGEWLKGAGQFAFMEELSEAEWEAMKPRGR